MSHRAYVEELPDEPFDVNQFLQQDNQDDGVPPAAPSPPYARPLKKFNVFDFMVGQSTPNISNANIPPRSSPTPPPEISGLVPYDYEANGYINPDGARDENGNVPLVKHETAEVPAPELKTPAPADQRKSKDKKRKRLHIDTNSPLHEPQRDEEMTDAPPMLHSGLTGGLNRLAVFPPSPDYSGGDGNEPSPSSPSKKKKKAQKSTKQHPKHSKHAKSRPESGGIFGRLKSSSNPTTTKSKKRKTDPSPTKPKTSTHRHHNRRHTISNGKPSPKAIEFKSDSKNEQEKGSNAMIVYREPADLFMSLVNKGPDSERGCSLNKALKRFHRERQESSDCRGKDLEEKDLFKSLRLKRNDRGEVVLFSIPDEFKDII